MAFPFVKWILSWLDTEKLKKKNQGGQRVSGSVCLYYYLIYLPCSVKWASCPERALSNIVSHKGRGTQLYTCSWQLVVQVNVEIQVWLPLHRCGMLPAISSSLPFSQFMKPFFECGSHIRIQETVSPWKTCIFMSSFC